MAYMFSAVSLYCNLQPPVARQQPCASLRGHRTPSTASDVDLSHRAVYMRDGRFVRAMSHPKGPTWSRRLRAHRRQRRKSEAPKSSSGLNWRYRAKNPKTMRLCDIYACSHRITQRARASMIGPSATDSYSIASNKGRGPAVLPRFRTVAAIAARLEI